MYNYILLLLYNYTALLEEHKPFHTRMFQWARNCFGTH